MKSFLLKLSGLVLALGVTVAFTVAILVARAEPRVNRTYSLDADILFLGSSQVGCSIVEAKAYHNAVVWLSGQPFYSVAARLRELERRNSLDRISACVVYFNLLVLKQQDADSINESWWNELPISWRSSEFYPTSWFSKVLWGLSHLRFPDGFKFDEERPRGKIAIDQRDEKWLANFHDDTTNRAAMTTVSALPPDWKQAVLRCYSEMQDICRRHGIRMIAVDFPMLPLYRQWFPREFVREQTELAEEIAGLGIEFVHPVGTYGESDFFDAVHMTEKGAEKFTRDLYSQIGWPTGED